MNEDDSMKLRPKKILQQNKRQSKKRIKVAGEKWTTNEKKRLYNALCKYGVGDVERITRSIRTRSITDVSSKIKHYDCLARAELKKAMDKPESKYKDIENCDNWIALLRSLDIKPKPGPFLPFGIVLKLLELYGKHPDPKDVCGINFKDVYGWLYDCYCGNPTKVLDLATSAFLFKIWNHIRVPYVEDISSAADIINFILNSDKEIRTYSTKNIDIAKKLNKVGQPPVKTYLRKKSKKKEPQQLTLLKMLSEDPNLNPFDIPLEILKVDGTVSCIPKVRKKIKSYRRRSRSCQLIVNKSTNPTVCEKPSSSTPIVEENPDPV